METSLRDLRYEFRRLWQAPGFTSAAVITLALGVGANTAMFSVVNAVLFRVLPLRQPSQVVRLQEFHQHSANLTAATFFDVDERNHVFSQVAAYRIFSLNLSDPRQAAPPEQIDAAFVSRDFLPLVAVRPLVGPGFASEQFRTSAGSAVLLSYGLWRRHFNGDRDIVGKMITLHGKPCLIVGVMPMGFSFPESVEAWAPLTPDLLPRDNRRAHLLTTLARVKAGTSLEAVRADLQAISARIQQENHEVDPGFTFRAERLEDNLASAVRPTLLILLGAVALVLLIACANVANLLLARSLERRKEIVICTALGATPRRILRQVLTGSVLLGLLGGVAGCLLGLISVKVLYAAYPAAMPGLTAAAINWRVLILAFTISLFASILFGILPALHCSKLDAQVRLVEGGRSTSSARSQRIRSFLVIAEVSLAMMLLAGAGLLIRSFVLLQHVDPGFDSSRLAVVRLTLPDSRYPELAERTQFVNSVLDGLQTLPGVQAVAAAGALPFDPVADTDLELEGHPYEPDNEPEAEILTATPEYFRTMGIRLIAGRTFTPQDIAGAPTALVINQTMARRFWPGETALGKRVVMKDWGPPLPGQVVGVVSDVKEDSLETETQPAIYYSFAQFAQGTLTTYLLVRSDPGSPSLAADIRSQIWSVDRDQPVNVLPMEQIIAGSLERRRFVLLLMGVFAAIALLLAMVGIYAVIAHSVSQRTQEFGIRMALGAQQHQLLLMVLRQGAGTLAIGLAIGVAGALSVTRLMRSLLFGTSPNDPLTFASTASILVAVALAASYIPARRAAKADPMVALRNE